MTKLTDTQSILLSTAAQRDTLSIMPLPETLRPQGAAKAIDALLKRDLIEEPETNEATAVHRTDGDLRFGLFATSAGLAAIGVEGAKETATDAPTASPLPRSTRPRRFYHCCNATLALRSPN